MKDTPSKKSKTAPRQSPRALANREKIYLTALDLFKRNGYDETTMEDIARASGLARASVFNHFPAKAEVLGEFFQRFTVSVILASKDSRKRKFLPRLKELFAIVDQEAVQNKTVIAATASLALGSGPLAYAEKKADETLINYLLELIEGAQVQGEVRTDLSSMFLAELLLGLMTATLHDWVNAGFHSSLEKTLSARCEVLFHGIASNR